VALKREGKDKQLIYISKFLNKKSHKKSLTPIWNKSGFTINLFD